MRFPAQIAPRMLRELDCDANRLLLARKRCNSLNHPVIEAALPFTIYRELSVSLGQVPD
jgi:hypothetical protein